MWQSFSFISPAASAPAVPHCHPWSCCVRCGNHRTVETAQQTTWSNSISGSKRKSAKCKLLRCLHESIWKSDMFSVVVWMCHCHMARLWCWDWNVFFSISRSDTGRSALGLSNEIIWYITWLPYQLVFCYRYTTLTISETYFYKENEAHSLTCHKMTKQTWHFTKHPRYAVKVIIHYTHKNISELQNAKW